jgi:hypothetical protein
MPTNRDTPPLPLPPREAEMTLLQHGTIAPPPRMASQSLPELPDAMQDSPGLLPPTRPKPIAHAPTGVPAPARVDRRPIEPTPPTEPTPPIEPTPGPNTNSTLAGQHPTISGEPGVGAPPGPVKRVQPVVPSPRPSVGQPHESSDLIQTFEAGPDDSQPGVPRPATPAKTIAPGAGLTVPPPGKLLRHGPPSPVKSPARPVPALVPARAEPVHAAVGRPLPPPAVLPLQTEHVVALVLAHRQRQKALDAWTRALEVTAVLAGVGALVSVPLGHWPMGCVLVLLGIALAAHATTLRHLALTSAHVSALLDALSGPR